MLPRWEGSSGWVDQQNVFKISSIPNKIAPISLISLAGNSLLTSTTFDNILERPLTFNSTEEIAPNFLLCLLAPKELYTWYCPMTIQRSSHFLNTHRSLITTLSIDAMMTLLTVISMMTKITQITWNVKWQFLTTISVDNFDDKFWGDDMMLHDKWW